MGRDIGPTPGQVDVDGGVIVDEISQVVTLEVSAEAAQFIATYDTPTEEFWYHLSLVDPSYEPVEPIPFEDIYEVPEELLAYEEDLTLLSQEG